MERPTPDVVSPIDVVPKPHSDKFRLVINMRDVNKVVKFEGLADLADIVENG